jgi:prefoldin subunit 5
MDGRAILEVAPSLASLQTARLQQLASDDWFFNMSEDEQKEYIEEHPHSKYAGHIGKTKQDFDTDTSTDADHNVNKVKANRVKSKRLANLQKVKQKLADEIDTLNDSMEKIDDKLEALHNKMKQKSGGKPGLVKRLIHRLSGSVRSLKTKRKDVKESLAEVRIKYKAVVKQIKLIKRGKA